MRVGYRLVPARDCWGICDGPGAVWADADTDEAARALVRMADLPEQRAALGARAMRLAQDSFGGQGVRDALLGIGFAAPGAG